MQSIYNHPNSKDVLEILNETAETAFNCSISLWEKQVDAVRQNARRNVNRLFSAQQLTSPEEVLNFQRQVSEDELAQWQKASVACQQIASDANQSFIQIAQKGENVVRQNFGSSFDNAAPIFANGKETLFSDIAQQATKTMGEMFQAGFDLACQTARSNTEAGLQPNGDQVSASKATAGKKKAAK